MKPTPLRRALTRFRASAQSSILGPILAFSLALPFAAWSAPQAPEPGALSAALAELQRRSELVQSIGWRLITGNAPFCDQTRPATGLLLQDVAAYSSPSAVRAALGIEGDIAVQARALGSPAERARLPVDAEVLAIGGRTMRDLPPTGQQRWQRLAHLHREIDAALAAQGRVDIAWRTKDQPATVTTLVGIPACASHFELIGGSKGASANGRRVAIGEDFVGFTYPEELLAAAIAHELAHNLLDHPAWLAKNGRKRAHIRATEREADRLMPWLLHNGGYDPAAAERFMRVWGPAHDGGLFRRRTHDGWDERSEFIAAELPLTQQFRAENAAADWRRDFQRDAQFLAP